jgi:hypothetical protein
MFDQAKKTNHQKIELPPPTKCGVTGCDERCDVWIKKYNVARCAKHYMADIDRARLSSLQQATKRAEDNEKTDNSKV